MRHDQGHISAEADLKGWQSEDKGAGHRLRINSRKKLWDAQLIPLEQFDHAKFKSEEEHFEVQRAEYAARRQQSNAAIARAGAGEDSAYVLLFWRRLSTIRRRDGQQVHTRRPTLPGSLATVRSRCAHHAGEVYQPDLKRAASEPDNNARRSRPASVQNRRSNAWWHRPG